MLVCCCVSTTDTNKPTTPTDDLLVIHPPILVVRIRHLDFSGGLVAAPLDAPRDARGLLCSEWALSVPTADWESGDVRTCLFDIAAITGTGGNSKTNPLSEGRDLKCTPESNHANTSWPLGETCPYFCCFKGSPCSNCRIG